MLGTLGDAEPHGLFADGLAEAELPIDDGDHVILEDDFNRAVGQHLASFEPLHIRRYANDSVRIVADQVRLDKMRRDAFGLGFLATGGVEDGGYEGTQAVVLNFHGMNSEGNAFGSWRPMVTLSMPQNWNSPANEQQ